MTNRTPVLLLLLLAACADETVSRQCAPRLELQGWDNPLRTELITRLGGPVHSARDVFAEVGEIVAFEAKFSYGPTSADLEGERVAAFLMLEGCRYIELGEQRTDGDGRVWFAFDTSELNEPDEQYSVEFVVLGDGSHVRSQLFLHGRAPIVVFDIDGTLTTSDLELVDGIVLHHVGATSNELFSLAGSPLSRAQWLRALDTALDENAEIHAGAADVAWDYAERGIQPVYITGRPYLYDAMTRRWLLERGLPAGPLFMVQEITDSLPANVGAYKANILEELRLSGREIVAAYGNATTDVCAYAAAGIEADDTFIIGPHAGTACPAEGGDATNALLTYEGHVTR